MITRLSFLNCAKSIQEKTTYFDFIGLVSVMYSAYQFYLTTCHNKVKTPLFHFIAFIRQITTQPSFFTHNNQYFVYLFMSSMASFGLAFLLALCRFYETIPKTKSKIVLSINCRKLIRMARDIL